MAANQATVDVRYLGPNSHSNQNQATGFITPNASVQAGGDYVLPSQFGLGTLDELFLTVPGNADGSALSAIIIPVVRSKMPQRGAQVLIQYFSALGTEAVGAGLDGLTIPFIANGS